MKSSETCISALSFAILINFSTLFLVNPIESKSFLAAAITTGKHLVQIIKSVCAEKGYGKWKDQVLPPKDDFEKAQTLCRSFLKEFFGKIDAYKHALSNDPSEIPELRAKDSPKNWGLLFKPMPQLALADAILYLKEDLLQKFMIKNFQI